MLSVGTHAGYKGEDIAENIKIRAMIASDIPTESSKNKIIVYR